MNRFWIIDEFNRNKKNPFEQKFFPFYEFLGPETDIMVQFLDPETDVRVQFLAPEIVIMGERNYIVSTPGSSTSGLPTNKELMLFSPIGTHSVLLEGTQPQCTATAGPT